MKKSFRTSQTRLVYTSGSSETAVTIDYHQSLRLFLSQQEQYPFSAERMLRMLNGQFLACRVELTALGRLHIVVGDVCCVLTQQAVTALRNEYHARRDLQHELPLLNEVFCADVGKQHLCLTT